MSGRAGGAAEAEEMMDEQKPNESQAGGGSPRRRRILYAVLGLAVVAVAAVAFATPPLMAAFQAREGFHRPWRGGWGHHHAMTPEAAKEHIQVAAKWALREIDANEQQQERINQVLSGAVDDLFRLKEQHKANREAFAAQLGGPAIDRAALEEIRKSEMTLADDASKRFVQALADVAEVLTPEQRQHIIEHVHRHRR